MSQFHPVHPVKITSFLYKAACEQPVVTSFGKMGFRSALWVKLESSSGDFGWGEIWCNFPDCGGIHRANLLHSFVAPHLLGKTFPSPAALSAHLDGNLSVMMLQCGEYGPFRQIMAGIDMAAWDMAARIAHQPLYKLLGGEKATSIGVYASGISPGVVREFIKQKRDLGYTAYKIKIGMGYEKDMRAINDACDILKKNEQLAVDVNQAWNLDVALDMVQKIASFPVIWIEEPLRADSGSEDWEILAKASSVPLAAGENMLERKSFTLAIQSGAIRIFQPDAAKWGGVSGCLDVAREAITAKRRYCPHFLGGGIGLLASAHILAAAGGDGLLEIDANPNPLREGLTLPLPAVKNGRIKLSQNEGLGAEPDIRKLKSYLVDLRESSE